MPEVIVPEPNVILTPPPAPKRYELPPEPAPKAEAPPAASEPAQDTEASAPPATPDAKPEPEVTPELAAKREGRRFEKKLDKVIKARAEAEARAELLQARVSELEKLDTPKPPEGEPKLEQFDYDPEKYGTAKAEYAEKRALQKEEQRRREETFNQTKQRLVSNWEEKLSAAEDKVDDLDERVANLRPTNSLMIAIMDAENGPEIAQYLLKHPVEDKRIGSLSEIAQIREIGKLEARLLSEAPKPKAPSKAPAPITPLTGAASIVTDVPTEQDSYKTWLMKRNKQLGRR